MRLLFALGYCNCSLFHEGRFYTCCLPYYFAIFMGRAEELERWLPHCLPSDIHLVITAYGKNRYLNNMPAAVKKMHFDGFSVSLEAYNCMLGVYGKEGEMDKFRDVLQRMKASNCSANLYTYNILINIYGEKGWIDEVTNVLMELKECGVGPDLCSYDTLIKAYGVAGMVEDAVALVKEMRKNGIEPDRITYTNLINALKRNDKFLKAVKWSLWMKQMGL